MTIFGSNMVWGLSALELYFAERDVGLRSSARFLWMNRWQPAPERVSIDSLCILKAAMMLVGPMRERGLFDAALKLEEVLGAFYVSDAQWAQAWSGVFRSDGADYPLTRGASRESAGDV